MFLFSILFYFLNIYLVKNHKFLKNVYILYGLKKIDLAVKQTLLISNKTSHILKMDIAFPRVESILNRLRDVVKCQICLTLKEEDLMIFFHACDHFYCLDCIGKGVKCPLCENILDKPTKILNDKNILSLYQTLAKFQLPSKDDVEKIYNNHIESKKQILKTIQMGNDTSCKNEEPVEESPKNSRRSRTTNLNKNTSEVKDVKINSNSTLVKDDEKNSSSVITSSDDISPVDDTPKVNKKSGRLKKNENVTPLTTMPKGKRIINSGRRTPAGRGKNVTFESTPIVTKQNANMDITPAGSSKGNSSFSKLNINKRNAKGETQLHIACKKSNFSVMSELIAAGANPNAQDNAGWTPLHDSVFSGKIDVIKFLLDNGAKVNVRGLENTTALHEAIATGNIAVVKLLLEYGADIEAMNIFRQTPLDLVTKHNLTEFKDLLLKAGKNSKMNAEAFGTEDVVQNLVIYKHNLTIEDEKLVNKFADKFDATLAPSLTSKTCPSHIVVPTDNVNITWGFITSVFSGCWVVTIDWVKDSLKEDSLKPASSYESSKISVSGFTKSRTNKLNNLPGLFSGCHFFLGGNFEFYSVKNLTFGKEDVKALIVQNGGSCLKRCPDPESLALEKSVPFHANPSSSIQGTSHFIIYQSDRWDPELKYNMSHMKSLPIDWLVTCIFKFELVDPNNKDVPYCDFL